MIAVYAGSFDPFTNGHLEVVEQAAKVFRQVVVLVADNPGKRHWFDQGARVGIARESVGSLATVAALPSGQATVEYAYRRKACLVRGLGEFTDYPGEKTLLGINSRLRPEVETVFLMTKEAGNQVRSSSVREVIKYPFGWRSVRDALPGPSFNAVLVKMAGRRDRRLETLLGQADLSRYIGRPYHNLEHIAYMLDFMWQRLDGKTEPEALWTAIVFHDMLVDSDPGVSGPDAIDLSVEALRRHVSQYGLEGCELADVERLIRATEHGGMTGEAARSMSASEKLIRDADLAVLGESPYEYARYARAIREEYGPKYGYLSEAFRQGRKVFLTRLLSTLDAGLLTDPDTDAAMRVNLLWELEELAQGR